MNNLEELKEEMDKLREMVIDLNCKLINFENNQTKQKEDLAKLCTIDEKIILKNLYEIKRDWYIARDKTGLYLFNHEPRWNASELRFDLGISDGRYWYEFDVFSHLFKFVEESDWYNITDLLSDIEEVEL